SDTQRGQQTDACLYGFGAGLVVSKKASFVSMDADGFTVNFTTADTNAGQVVSLALKGVAAKAGSFLKSTTVPPASAFVQGKENRSTANLTSLTATFTTPSTTGNLVVVTVDFGGLAGAVVSSVVDNKGNTYRRVFGPTDWGGSGDRMYTYYAKNITGGGGAA